MSLSCPKPQTVVVHVKNIQYKKTVSLYPPKSNSIKRQNELYKTDSRDHPN